MLTKLQSEAGSDSPKIVPELSASPIAPGSPVLAPGASGLLSPTMPDNAAFAPSVSGSEHHSNVSDMRVQIKNVDMPMEMQNRAVELAQKALASARAEQKIGSRDIAGSIKKEFDQIYGPAWHCIVGKAFGSFVTHEAHCFIFFYIDNWAVMLFKTA